MIDCWYIYTVGMGWVPESLMGFVAFDLTARCHHNAIYRKDLLGSPTRCFVKMFKNSIKSIERNPGSSLIAFSVKFHGYKRLRNLILIILRSADVRNQFYWFCIKVTFRRFSDIYLIGRDFATVVPITSDIRESKSVPRVSVAHDLRVVHYPS